MKKLIDAKIITIAILSVVIILMSMIFVSKKPQTISDEITIRLVQTHDTQTIIVEVPKKYTCKEDPECAYLAEAIYFEARGESLEGQIAVGWVILNRVNSRYFPNSIAEVIKYRCHFSYRCDGSMKQGIREKSAYEQAKRIAKGIVLGVYEDPTNGANHYLNPKKVSVIPKWARVYPVVASIGNHIFHKR